MKCVGDTLGLECPAQTKVRVHGVSARLSCSSLDLAGSIDTCSPMSWDRTSKVYLTKTLKTTLYIIDQLQKSICPFRHFHRGKGVTLLHLREATGILEAG